MQMHGLLASAAQLFNQDLRIFVVPCNYNSSRVATLVNGSRLECKRAKPICGLDRWCAARRSCHCAEGCIAFGLRPGGPAAAQRPARGVAHMSSQAVASGAKFPAFRPSERKWQARRTMRAPAKSLRFREKSGTRGFRLGELSEFPVFLREENSRLVRARLRRQPDSK